MLASDHKLRTPKHCQNVVPARHLHRSILYVLSTRGVFDGQKSRTFNPHGKVQPERYDYYQKHERLIQVRKMKRTHEDLLVRENVSKVLTKIGSNNSNGILVTTLPASLNSRMTNWMRLRSTRIIKLTPIVIIVAIMANTSSVVFRRFPISDRRSAATSSEYCRHNKIVAIMQTHTTVMSTNQTTMSALYLNSNRMMTDATVMKKKCKISRCGSVYVNSEHSPKAMANI